MLHVFTHIYVYVYIISVYIYPSFKFLKMCIYVSLNTGTDHVSRKRTELKENGGRREYM